MKAVRVIYPKPPTKMSREITVLPKRVYLVGVSTTIRPVTQRADAEVKRASRKERAPLWDMGRYSIKPPKAEMII
jgi:hypothetical protein